MIHKGPGKKIQIPLIESGDKGRGIGPLENGIVEGYRAPQNRPCLFGADLDPGVNHRHSEALWDWKGDNLAACA
jgi:hypothetical protein